MSDKLDISLNQLHLEDLNNEDHPSYFLKTPNYEMLIFRLPLMKEDGDLGANNIGFIFVDDDIFIFDKTKEDNFEILDKNHTDLHEMIDASLDHSIELLHSYLAQIVKLEDALYDRNVPSLFVDYWFDLKKDISRMERLFSRASEVMQEFVKSSHNKIGTTLLKYQDILEHLDRSEKNCNHQLNKLDTLYNYYTSLKNDKINKNIYVLTVLSAVFLPLNLVVGFFGMNTQGMFFSSFANGTLLVFLLLVSVFLFLVVGFPIFQKIEKLIIRRILGKYDFYQNISKHMNKITRLD